MDLKVLAKDYYDLAIKMTQEFVQINSIYDETTSSKEKPFGEGVDKALKYVGKKAEEMGFNVNYCDGYCTEISYGEGELIAIYAHADVVPVSGNWLYPPFSATIKDDIMYGRGTSDDKGPAIAALMALKMLKDHHLIDGYKVSLVIGGNEESGSACLEYYFNELHRPYPKYGFTPDGDFPLIYGEKAIAKYSVKLPIDLKEVESFSSGVVINSVADIAKTKFNVDLDEKAIKKFVKENNLTSYTYENRELIFTGKASHGSLPFLGVNAGLLMLKFIGEQFNYEKLIKTAEGYQDGRGKGFGVYFESQLLHETTYNVGLLEYKDGVLNYGVNFRYPEIVDVHQVIAKLNTLNLGEVILDHAGDYLLVDPQSEMIQTLLKTYQEETGDYHHLPEAIGGGTYAKESKNTVAFGSHFPGRVDNIHDANEKIHLEDLTKSISIYAKAIHRLGKLAGK